MEHFQFPCLLFFSQVQNLLLLSPYLSLDLVNFQLAFSQFMLFVIFYVFFYSSSPVLHWCICQGKPYFFLHFSYIVRTDGSCSWHNYVPRQIFTTYSFVPCHKRFCTIGQFHSQWDSLFYKNYFCLIFTFILFLPPKVFLI